MKDSRPRLCFALHVAPATDLVLAAGHAGDGLGVGDVLLGQDASAEGCARRRIQDRNGALQHDDAVIQMFIHKVDRAARPPLRRSRRLAPVRRVPEMPAAAKGEC